MHVNETGGNRGSGDETCDENGRTHHFNVCLLLKLSYIVLFLLTLSVAHFIKPNFELLRSFECFYRNLMTLIFIIDTNKSLLQKKKTVF